jgi:magnesium-transporting ATPase (P-type)
MGEALIIVVAILFGLALPITPILILWVNLVTEITLSLALAFEKAEPDVMTRPPRQRRAPLLAGDLVWRVAVVTTLIVVGTFWQFEATLGAGASIAEARSVAVNLVVLFEIFYLANARSFSSPGWRFPSLSHALPILVAITVVMILQLLLTYLPAMNLVFGTAPLSLEQWAIMLMIAASVFAVIEIERLTLKLLRRWT